MFAPNGRQPIFTSITIHRINLTHWGRVTHIGVSDLTIIGSDNGLSPGRRQAIIRTNAGILLIKPLGTNFSEILIEYSNISIQRNAFESVVCEKAAILSRPQYVKASVIFLPKYRQQNINCVTYQSSVVVVNIIIFLRMSSLFRICVMQFISFNPTLPIKPEHDQLTSDAYMRQWARSSLIQIMARRLTGAKPLPETVLGYC